MSDLWFVVAGYGVILGGLALYAVTLSRRLRRAEADADANQPPDEPRPAA